MKLEELRNKKILILGFGREGKDTFLFLRKLFPKKLIAIADRNREIARTLANQKYVKFHLGNNYLKATNNYDVVIKAPGIPFKILPKAALKKIATQTDIFFDNCPGIIIGVTGTKGKSTTSSMIYDLLKAGNIKASLIGNIGKPVLSSLLRSKKEDVFVYELSSHQLYNMRKSPQIAVFLNIYPEHLDYYRSFKEYAKAKANITLHQGKGDWLIYNSKDKLVAGFAKRSKAKKIPIQGEYYELDKTAARKVGEIFNIPEKTASGAIRRFKYLAHRLELVGSFRGITFYNDALATIPEATIAAIRALGPRAETIILGGFDRNIDFKNLAKEVIKSKIKNLILFPTTGQKIWQEIASQGRGELNHFFVNNMQEAVKLSYQHTRKGKICLLSTASSSFSLFRDYKEKGNLFKKYVKQLGKIKNS